MRQLQEYNNTIGSDIVIFRFCIDCASLGKRCGLEGASAPSLFVWIRIMLQHRPHWTLVENVQAWPWRLVASVQCLGRAYNFQESVWTPPFS